MRPCAVLLALSLVAAACSEPVERGQREIEVETWSTGGYSAALARHVDAAGQVDYQGWHDSKEDVAALDDFLERVANASPDSKPALFPATRDKLAYWMNAYNALVIRSILDHWPLDSVQDVKAGVSFMKGQGFFANQRFRVGRAWLSLDEIEKRLRSLDDPRMHFAINCGSKGCPPLDATAFAGQDIDAALDRKARAFVNDAKNVRVDETARRVELSKIFEWYEEDFSATLPQGATILDYIAAYAEQPLREKLARAKGFEVRYQGTTGRSTGAAARDAHGTRTSALE